MRTNSLAIDNLITSNPQQMRLQLKTCLATLGTKVNAHMQKCQARQKFDCNRRVCKTSFIQVGNYVFVDKPSSTETKEGSAIALEKSTYNRLQQRTSGPYRILKVWVNTKIIDKHGIPNTVSVVTTIKSTAHSEAVF